MYYNQIPCFYKPSQVIIIDDNLDFLNSFQLTLPDSLNYLVYQNPYQALNDISEMNKNANFSHHKHDTWLEFPEDQTIEQPSIQINIRKIHELVCNPQRFEEISTIIIDYAMPGLNGLDFCKQLKDKNIKKILLTAEVSNELAIQAFNEHLIDKFFLKSDDNLTIKLDQAIKELQHAYFVNLSNYILEVITNADKKIASLEDSEFVKLFYQVCKQYEIVEYYLLDNQGSFLMLNAQAEPIWFAVKTDEEMNNLVDIAALSKAPEDILSALKSRKKLPFFYSDSDLNTNPANWDKYFHHAQTIDGQNRYYYAIIEKSALYSLNVNDLISYETYLSDLNHRKSSNK